MDDWIIPYETCCVKRKFNKSTQNIDPGQPARSTQAELVRNCSLLVNCLHVKVSCDLIILSVPRQSSESSPDSVGECNTILSAYTMYRHLE